jgi:hypothetical protein
MELNTKQALSTKVEPGATGIHYFAGDEVMEITTADKTFMTKIRKLAKVCEEVVIDEEPNKDNGGFMLALVPTKCLKLGKKRPAPKHTIK